MNDVQNVGLRFEVLNSLDVPQATYILYDFYSGTKGDITEAVFELDSSMLMDAEYKGYYTFFNKSDFGSNKDLDCVPSLSFHKITTTAEQKWIWRPNVWGYIQLPAPQIRSME